MYISKIIINGFKSYSFDLELDELSPHINVIVGNNGSGKSNLLAAIQFVLTDDYDNLRNEERLLLFHEGVGPQVTTASVEIIFENSKRRLPFDQQYVSIKRVLSLKNDQYYVENKLVKKQDIINILESAGISKSNKYYIVKQGKITQLAVAHDSGRLKLLHQIAGAKIFDEKKSESDVILKDTIAKRQQIDKFTDEIEEKLQNLEFEKSELVQFNKLSTGKNSIEYCMYERELIELEQKYEQLVSTIANCELEYTNAISSYENVCMRYKELQSIQANAVEEKSTIMIELDSLRKERHQELDQKIAQLKFQLSDLDEHTTEESNLLADTNNIRDRINFLEKKLSSEVQSKYDELCKQELLIKNQIGNEEAVKLARYIVYDKTRKFSSKSQRDLWLKSEIKKLTKNKDEVYAQLQTYETQLQLLEDNSKRLRSQIQTSEDTSKLRPLGHSEPTELRLLLKEEANLKSEHYKVIIDKNDACRHELIKIESVNNLRNCFNKNLKNFQKFMSRSTYMGMESLDRLSRKHNLKHYGYLIDNIMFDEEFETVVQVTAGNYLFNIIVDDEKAAADILSLFNEENLPGEISFIPLNKIKPTTTNFTYTDQMEQYCVPLSAHITINNSLKGWEQVFQLVFGNTILCKDLETASSISKKHKINGITIEGDRATYKGTLMGGYINKSFSKIINYRQMVDSKKSLEREEKNLAELRRTIDAHENRLDSLNLKIQKIRNSIIQIEQKQSLHTERIGLLGEEQNKVDLEIKNKIEVVTLLKEKIANVDSKITNLTQEMSEYFSTNVNQTENEKIVTNLTLSIKNLKEKLSITTEERIKVEKEKFDIENELANSLYLKINDISMEESSTLKTEQTFSRKSSELSMLMSRANEIDQRIYHLISISNVVQEKIDNSVEQLDKLQNERQNMVGEKNSLQQKLESYSAKKHVYASRKLEMNNKLKSIDLLDRSQLDELRLKPLKELWKSLNQINDSLNKFSGINKKAYEQYLVFSKKKDQLIQRKTELDRSYDAIVDMMKKLEERKNQTICKTFDQLSSEFSIMFNELIPNGYAKLSMVHKNPLCSSLTTSQEDNTNSDPINHIVIEGENENSRELVGISIDVSFNSSDQKQLAKSSKINALSGGQKTVVALALIFAMQKCDSSPFYLFDEIDQALDPQYRFGVAKIINKLSKNAQFIVTTFSTELIPYASCIFGVKFSGKVSHISKLNDSEVSEYFDSTPAIDVLR